MLNHPMRWVGILLCAGALGTGCNGQVAGGLGGEQGSAGDGGGGADGGALVDIGAACIGTACGATCCTAEQLCVEGTCKDLGPKCDELWPCPDGYACDPSMGRCIPVAEKCEFRPEPGAFAPQVEWTWTGSAVAPGSNQVMMTPMVANLTDDNGDGAIDREDIPDIVFVSFPGDEYTAPVGVLRVVSGDGSKEHFSVNSVGFIPWGQVAIADIDNDQQPEIVACGGSGDVMYAISHDGTVEWQQQVRCVAPAIADLDGDGAVEVVTDYAVVAGAGGAVKWQQGTGEGFPAVADIDGDGALEVVGGNVVYAHDGTQKWKGAGPDGHPALADLDGDGDVEIVTVSSMQHELRAYHHDGTPYWGPVDVNQGHADPGDPYGGRGGGPPTIADFDGDGQPEIAAAGGWGYVIFEHDGTPKWFQSTQDISSRSTGSSVFDFDGDGKAEVVYGDEHNLRIYRGDTGAVLFSQCNSSGTLHEYPVIADIDNDGHAEIVVATNSYAWYCAGGGTGIKVLGDATNSWVRTRRIWNQHTYHVTNVDEDGRVPQQEQPNWKNPHLNNFRQNVQPGGLFDAPDSVAEQGDASCGSEIEVSAAVTNRGAARLEAGTKVTLYLDDPAGDQALQTVATTKALYPGQSEQLSFKAPIPAGHQGQTLSLFLVVDDDGQGQGTANECKEDNNRLDLGQVSCLGID